MFLTDLDISKEAGAPQRLAIPHSCLKSTCKSQPYRRRFCSRQWHEFAHPWRSRRPPDLLFFDFSVLTVPPPSEIGSTTCAAPHASLFFVKSGHGFAAPAPAVIERTPSASHLAAYDTTATAAVESKSHREAANVGNKSRRVGRLVARRSAAVVSRRMGTVLKDPYAFRAPRAESYHDLCGAYIPSPKSIVSSGS